MITINQKKNQGKMEETYLKGIKHPPIQLNDKISL